MICGFLTHSKHIWLRLQSVAKALSEPHALGSAIRLLSSQRNGIESNAHGRLGVTALWRFATNKAEGANVPEPVRMSLRLAPQPDTEAPTEVYRFCEETVTAKFASACGSATCRARQPGTSENHQRGSDRYILPRALVPSCRLELRLFPRKATIAAVNHHRRC